MPNQTFRTRVSEGLQDAYRRNVVGKVQDYFRAMRNNIFEELGNVEEWRERAAQIRSHTIENLDAYLEMFSENIQKNGGHVAFAADAAEANRYIQSVAKQHEVKTVVKSKSMVTEEIHLNGALEDIGVEVFETDLGEFIIQLDNDRPSHIVGPAMHKSKQQVAEIFSKKAGETLPADAQELGRFAREYLRDKFFRADMGITGCNFGVAESGSVVIVSNEGNVEMTSSLPRVHVVVMGMERLVPSWEELDVLISLLPRSATGQRTISYATAIHGPKRENDLDGPEEWHVVIVDNGRSKLLGTKYQQALNCIRCGNCSNVCPVYRHIGGHAYGGVYNGPIGAVITPLMENLPEWKELAFASSLCGACTEACPVKIPLHEYLIELRHDVTETSEDTWSERMVAHLFGTATAHPSLYEMGQKAARLPFLSSAAGPMKAWQENRDLPEPAKQTFRDWWRQHKGGER